jgi:hypothetical protein
VVAGAEQNGAALGHGNAGLLHRRFQIGGRDLGAGRDVTQIDADARHMQFSSGYLFIGWPSLLKCRGASMWVPAWSGIEMNIEESPCTLPDSANDSSWVFQMPWMIGGWPG